MIRRLFPVILFGSAAACGGGDDKPAAPDHTKVFEQKTQAKTYTDSAYAAETPTLFRTTDVLPDLDVRALASAGGKVYAGTPSGLFRLNAAGSAFEAVDLGAPASSVVDLAAAADGTLAVAHAASVDLLATGGALTHVAVPTSSTAPVVAVAFSGTRLVAATQDGLFSALAAETNASPLANSPAGARDIAVLAGVVYVATAHGLASYDLQTSTALGVAHVGEDDVRALATSGDGATVYVAMSSVFIEIPSDGSEPTLTGIGKNALANGDLRAIAEANGAVITGHGIGATVLTNSTKDHYHSLRWIPDEEVTAVLLLPDLTRFIGTKQGIARIAYIETTLAAKAELDEMDLARHWRMDGFLDDNVEFEDPWNLTGAPHTGDNDNDGLWTEMQIGTWCLAYAETHDERFYQEARKALEVMFLEFDVPAATFMAKGLQPGFITRSLVRDDEGSVYSDKSTRDNWHQQEFGGRTYYWKDDTSSDEYAGHYFGIPLFYDLCAKNEAEKDELRTRIRSSTDYIIAGGYLLNDLDGMPTTFGRWKNLGAAADGIDACTARYGFDIATCLESFGGGGWLNSLEILGHLLATWHMTGDQKYYDEYERLFTAERYGKMIPVIKDTLTVTSPRFANHSDHELAMLSYYTLLRYEPNADRRAMIVQSIRDFYEYEREEHNPWQVATIASAYGEDVDLDGAIKTLEDMSTDWREVRYDNSYRQDAEKNVVDRHGGDQFKTVFPYDEIRTMKWNGNPYAVDGGGNERAVMSPTPYLIAYWMARYHGLILAQ